MLERSFDEQFEEFKLETLTDASGGMWIREPFLDSRNWFPDLAEDARLKLSERVLRELLSDGLIGIRHSGSDVEVGVDELDALFASPRWVHGLSDPLYDDVEYYSTDAGLARSGFRV